MTRTQGLWTAPGRCRDRGLTRSKGPPTWHFPAAKTLAWDVDLPLVEAGTTSVGCLVLFVWGCDADYLTLARAKGEKIGHRAGESGQHRVADYRIADAIPYY